MIIQAGRRLKEVSLQNHRHKNLLCKSLMEKKEMVKTNNRKHKNIQEIQDKFFRNINSKARQIHKKISNKKTSSLRENKSTTENYRHRLKVIKFEINVVQVSKNLKLKL